MWVAKGLLPPLKLGMFVKPCRFIWCPIGWLVGWLVLVGARAVSHKTPIYLNILLGNSG